jgi:phosphonate transport system substrate-binding protein
MFKTLVRAALLAVALVSPLRAQEMPKEINFGIISTESTQNLRKDWEPFLADMQKKVGVKINAFFAPDYAGVIEGMRFNKVHVAWYGNKSAMEAVDRASGEVFVQSISADGSMGYYSFMAAHKDSPYKSLEDILKNSRAVSFGIGDPNSTSGFLVPSYYAFAVNNFDPKTGFKVIRGANHETNILAVANKQVDASVFASDTWEKLEKTRPEVASQMRVIWKSPMIPSDPIVYRKDLHPDVKKRLKDFFLAYGKSEATEKETLKRISFGGFVDSSNAQLKPIRQLELFKEKNQVNNDTRLSEAEKKTKVADIDRRLAELR